MRYAKILGTWELVEEGSRWVGSGGKREKLGRVGREDGRQRLNNLGDQKQPTWGRRLCVREGRMLAAGLGKISTYSN